MSAPRFVDLTPELLDYALRDMRDQQLLWTSEIGRITEIFRHLAVSHKPSSALIGRGQVLACAGLVPHWPGRAEAWMLVTRAARKRDLVQAVRRCQVALNAAQCLPEFRRIEMYVRASEPWACRFAHSLGFLAEGVLRAWDPEGRDMILFSRISQEAR